MIGPLRPEDREELHPICYVLKAHAYVALWAILGVLTLILLALVA